MLCFSRDTEILSVAHHSSSNPIHAVLRGKQVCLENTVAYPPSGIIPFHGFTMYGMLLCTEDHVHLRRPSSLFFFNSVCSMLYI